MCARTTALTLLILLIFLPLLACTASSTHSTSTEATVTKPVEQPTITSNLPPPSASEIAWQKVVDSARQEGKVTIYSYSMVGDVGLAVSQAFHQKYGITVDIITGRGAEMAQRIKMEQLRRELVADLMDANPTQLMYLKESGGTVSSGDIPVLQDKGAWQVYPLVADNQGHILVHTLLNYSANINTKLVPAGEEPKSIKELTQPRWKGKIAATDPAFSSGIYILLATLLRHNFVDQETVLSMGKNDLQLSVNAQTATTELARGTYYLLVGLSELTFAPMLKEGAPIKAIALQEGTVATGNAMAAINGGPHPNAAKLFLNWLLSQEGQTLFLRAQALSSPRKDIPDFRPLPAQIKPYRLVALTDEDEQENARLFREQFLVKLWKK